MALWRIFLAGCVALTAMQASGDEPMDQPAYGQIAWARLQTQSPTWNRHVQGDPNLLLFFRENTKLHVGNEWRSADVEDLSQMTLYPFIVSEGIHQVTDEQGRKNLREYMLRGGFLFIDACINTDVNPDPDEFLRMEKETLQSVLPNPVIERMPDDSPIFHNYYDMKEGLPHSYMEDVYDPAWAKQGLSSVYVNKRLVCIISLSGLQCGWDRKQRRAGHFEACMKMLVNIYTYALMH